MSTRGIGERRRAPRGSRRDRCSGRSPWRLTTTSWRAPGIERVDRLDARGRSPRDDRAGQHRPAARGCDRGGDLALGAGDDHRPDAPPPRRGARHGRSSARRAISASGLPGSRVERHPRGNDDDRRRGMAPSPILRRYAASGWPAAVLARFNHISFELSAKIGFSPPRFGAGKPRRPMLAEGWSMSFEANKIAAAILVAMILAMVSGILAEQAGAARDAGEARLRGRGRRREAAQPAAAAAPAGPEPIGPLLARRAPMTARTTPTVVRRLPHLRQGRARTASAPISTASSATRSRTTAAAIDFSPALKTRGRGQDLDGRPPQRVAVQAAGFRQGHQDDLRRPARRPKDRADVIAYLNSLSDSPKPLARSRPQRRARGCSPGRGRRALRPRRAASGKPRPLHRAAPAASGK